MNNLKYKLLTMRLTGGTNIDKYMCHSQTDNQTLCTSTDDNFICNKKHLSNKKDIVKMC